MVTTPDGTQYWFGRGCAVGAQRRRSFGNHANEPVPPPRHGLVLHAGLALEPRLRRRPARQHHVVLVRQGDQQVRAQQHRDRPRAVRPGGWLEADRLRHAQRPHRDRADAGRLRTGRPLPGRLRHQERPLAGHSLGPGVHGQPVPHRFPDVLDHQAPGLRDHARSAAARSSGGRSSHTFPDPGDGTRAGLWLDGSPTSAWSAGRPPCRTSSSPAPADQPRRHALRPSRR